MQTEYKATNTTYRTKWRAFQMITAIQNKFL